MDRRARASFRGSTTLVQRGRDWVPAGIAVGATGRARYWCLWLVPQRTEPAAKPAQSLPTTLTDVDLALIDNGGAVEDISGNYGPGYTGRLLIDGRTDPTWKVPSTWT